MLLKATIDPLTRAIVLDTHEVLAMKEDYRVSGIKFTVPNAVGIDIAFSLSSSAVRIMYKTPALVNYYIPTDFALTDDTATFSWIFDKNVTKTAGEVLFNVCAIITNSQQVVTKEWHSAPAKVRIWEDIHVENLTPTPEEIDQIGHLTQLINTKVKASNGTAGYLAKFKDGLTIENGPKLGSDTTTFLRNDGTWAAPTAGKYAFTDGTNGFSVSENNGTPVFVTVTPSIASNITGSGNAGYLAKFESANKVVSGPRLGTSTTTFLRNDGTWVVPYALATADANGLLRKLQNDQTYYLSGKGTWIQAQNNATTTSAGYVLDARMAKTLSDKINDYRIHRKTVVCTDVAITHRSADGAYYSDAIDAGLPTGAVHLGCYISAWAGAAASFSIYYGNGTNQFRFMSDVSQTVSSINASFAYTTHGVIDD